MDKTLCDIKLAKGNLEDQISCLLVKFEEENGVQLSDLSIYPREIHIEGGKTIHRQICTSITVKL